MSENQPSIAEGAVAGWKSLLVFTPKGDEAQYTALVLPDLPFLAVGAVCFLEGNVSHYKVAGPLTGGGDAYSLLVTHPASTTGLPEVLERIGDTVRYHGIEYTRQACKVTRAKDGRITGIKPA